MNIEEIINTVCKYFNLKLEGFQGKTRKREIVQARQIAVYFSKLMTKCSDTEIMHKIGGLDRTNLFHCLKTVNNLYDTDTIFRSYVNDIDKLLGQPVLNKNTNNNYLIILQKRSQYYREGLKR